MDSGANGALAKFEEELGKQGAGVTIREFIIDFFACIIPGAIFVFVFIACMAWPCWLVLQRLGQGATPVDLRALLEPFRVEVSFLLLALTYTMGFVLYRSEPKTPDVESFLRIRARIREQGGDPGWEDTWVTTGGQRCEFPYANLRRYLDERCFHSLAAMVPWDSQEASGPRSKNFLNALKNAIEYHCGAKANVLSRNEAHVRLMSSTWFMAVHLGRWSLISAVLSVLLGLRLNGLPNSSSWEAAKGLWCALVAVTGVLMVCVMLDDVQRQGPEIGTERGKADAAATPGKEGETAKKGRLASRLNDLRVRLKKVVSRRPRLPHGYALPARFVAICGLALLLASLGALDDSRKGARDALAGVCISGATFVIMWRLREKINDFFHYQRVREVVFTLQLAAIAFDKRRSDLKDIVSSDWVEHRYQPAFAPSGGPRATVLKPRLRLVRRTACRRRQ